MDGSYWDLGENYSTQSEPSFCALTSLVMALNSLGIDPKRKAWSTKPEIPWRWYTENSLLSFFEHAVNRKKNIINFFTSLIYNFFKRLWKIIN